MLEIFLETIIYANYLINVLLKDLLEGRSLSKD